MSSFQNCLPAQDLKFSHVLLPSPKHSRRLCLGFRHKKENTPHLEAGRALCSSDTLLAPCFLGFGPTGRVCSTCHSFLLHEELRQSHSNLRPAPSLMVAVQSISSKRPFQAPSCQCCLLEVVVHPSSSSSVQEARMASILFHLPSL